MITKIEFNSSSCLQDTYVILHDLRVPRDEYEPFGLSLRHQYPIKRISVVQWQIARLFATRKSHGQMREARVFYQSVQVVWNFEFALHTLDSDFQTTDGTHENLIGGIGDGLAGPWI